MALRLVERTFDDGVSPLRCVSEHATTQQSQRHGVRAALAAVEHTRQQGGGLLTGV